MPSKRHRVRLPKRVRLPRRVELQWKPKWEGEIRGWAYNHIINNTWRIEYIHDIDDLMQDAFMVFLRVCDSYPRVVEPAHFMSLYKMSLRNYLLDKGRELKRKRNIIQTEWDMDSFPEEAVDSKPDPYLGVTLNEGPLNSIIASEAPELQMLLDFLKEDCNLEKWREPQNKEGEKKPRVTLDTRLSMLLGIERFPFRKTFKRVLSTSDV